MANSKKRKSNAKAAAKARKAKPHVKARRAKRVEKKRVKRARPMLGAKAAKAMRDVYGDVPQPEDVSRTAVTTELHTAKAVMAAAGGAMVEAIAEPPATSSGLDPSEEKEILNALDEDYDPSDDDIDQ